MKCNKWSSFCYFFTFFYLGPGEGFSVYVIIIFMQGTKNKGNIKQLFSFYMIVLLTFVLGSTAIIFSCMEYRSTKRNAISDLGKICSSVGDNIDLQLHQMDTITLNTINSSDLRDAVMTYAFTEVVNPYAHTISRQRISSLLMELKGFDYSVRQLNVYSINDIGYGVGDYYGVIKGYKNSDWYLDTVDAAGLRNVTTGDSDSFGRITDGGTYLSLARTYYNSFHQLVGTIETRKYYKDIFKAAIENTSSYSPDIYVYDDKGSLIYPLDADEERSGVIYNSADSPVVKTGENFLKDYIFRYDMPNSEYTTILYVDGMNFLKPILPTIGAFIILFTIIYIVGIFAAHILSGVISNPIRSIYHFLLDRESGEQHKKLEIRPTNIREIDKLAHSINEYIDASEAQTRTMLGLQQQEVQAEMLALQSQMNSHFLYNSLACIEEMSLQGMHESVAIMVKDISTILRSISSNKERVITVEEELDLCDMYLECLKYRFGEDLTYEFDVEDTLLDYYLPKLCVQLLVENASKSTTSGPLPWHIRVHGYTEGENWFIEVIDTGPGFDPDVDRHLREQMDSILETGVLPSLKIEGMGILNIFIRLYLLDGITFLFDFGNNEEGGAFVKIGRSIENSKSNQA